MDRGHQRYGVQNGIKLQLKPSEYFHRNVSASFIQDRVGVYTREFLGVENLMWSSDYPHSETTFPRSREIILRDFDGIPEEDIKDIIHNNCARLLGVM